MKWSLMTALAFAVLAPMWPGAASAQVPVESCRGDVDPEFASVRWPDVPAEDVDVLLPTPDVALEVQNLDTRDLVVELEGVMDAGGQRAEISLGSAYLAARASMSVDVPLDGFGIDVSSLAFSGAVFVKAELRDATGALVRRTYSPTRFFHLGSAGTVVYGAEAKAAYYNAGDLLGQVVQSPGPEIAGVFEGGVGAGALGEDTGPLGAIDDITSGPPTWEFCMRWVYQSIDSGFELPGGVSEDHYTSGYLMKARGMKVKIEHPSFAQPKEGFASLNNGCFQFQSAANSGFTVTLYSEARLGATDNLVVKGFPSLDAHDQGQVTQWKFMANPGGSPRRVYYQNQASDVSNLMAFSTFTLHWVDSHTDPRLSGQRTLNVVAETLPYEICKEGCRSGNTIYLKGGPVTQEKFGIAHEVGHWLHGAWTGENTGTFNGMYTHDAPGEPMCAFNSPEDGPGEHAMRSKEYAAGAFTEGFGHFIAALAWNDHEETDGLFKYYKESITAPSYSDMAQTGYLVDLEGAAGALGGPTNWLGTQCVPEAGYSVEMDWLRFFWDYRTDAPAQVGDPIPTHHDVFSLIGFTRAHTPWTTVYDVYPAFVDAFGDADFNQHASFFGRFTSHAGSNGVAQ